MDACRCRIVDRTKEYVKKALARESSGHDWWHVYRVWSLAKRIAAHEGGDLFVIELAALLHDIADWKFHNGDLTVGPAKAREWLESMEVQEHVIRAVCDIVQKISFKGANVQDDDELLLEGRIVQDADRLDAMGAIGVARAFAYGGAKGRIIYDPGLEPVGHETAEAYSKSTSPTINHFYEKLLLVKDRMNTTYAQELATGRHLFMEHFLKEFFSEWDSSSLSPTSNRP